MEYRCYILGDPVAEPGALLRRLLHEPFPPAEERALAQRSLLSLRTTESSQTYRYPVAVSLPELRSPRSGTLTMPNPSMPSVDITVQFAVITEPRELERVMLRHYSVAFATGGQGCRMDHSAGLTPVSSMHEPASSAGASTVAAQQVYTEGPALHALPHALVLTFNPFSLHSYSKLRVAWAHSLRLLRQRRQARLSRCNSQSYQGLPQSSASVVQLPNASRSTFAGFPIMPSATSSVAAAAAAFPTTPTVASPLSPAVPTVNLGVFPPVLLVATRMELMQESMESTPLVRIASSLNVAETAQMLQAASYAEVGFYWDESLDALRMSIARSCIGELANAPAVSYNATYRARQMTISRALEAVQTQWYDEENVSDEEQDGAEAVTRPSTATLPNSTSFPASVAAAAPITARASSAVEAAEVSLPSVAHALPSKVGITQSVGWTDMLAAGTPAITTDVPELLPVQGSSLPTAMDSAHSNCTPHKSDGDESKSKPVQPFPEPDLQFPAPVEDASIAFPTDTVASNSVTGDSRSRGSLRGCSLRRRLAHTLAPLMVSSTAEMEDEKGRDERPPSLSSPSVPTATLAVPQPSSLSTARSKWTWRRHRRTGRTFYVERASGKSQYAHPPDYDGPPPPEAQAERAVRTCEGIGACGDDVSMAGAPATLGEGGHDLLAPDACDRHEGRSVKDDVATSPEKGGMLLPSAAPLPARESLTQDVAPAQQQERLQLRRAQNQRLEAQVQHLRVQLEELRAQAEANAGQTQRIALLRAELDEKEQHFSRQVAERNAQLATATLQTTFAIEELSEALQPAVVAVAGPLGAAGTSSYIFTDDGAAAARALYESRTAAPPAPVQHVREELQVALKSLEDALSRRDVTAEAVKTLRTQQGRLLQLQKAEEAQCAALTAQAVDRNEELTRLQGELYAAHEKIYELEVQVKERNVALTLVERRRQDRLDSLLAAQRRTSTQAQELERLRETLTVAKEKFRAAWARFHMSRGASRTAALERRKELLTSLESATARCARALVESFASLDSVCRMTHQLQSSRRQLNAVQLRERRHLLRACANAEDKLGSLIQAHYAPSATDHNDPDDEVAREMATLLLATAKEAYASWQAHDTRVVGPLLREAAREESRLCQIVEKVRCRPYCGEVVFDVVDGGSIPDASNEAAASVESSQLPVRWMREEVQHLGRVVARRSAAALHALSRYDDIAIDHHSASCHRQENAQKGGWAGLFSREVAGTSLTNADVVRDCEDAVARRLWAQCQGLAHR